MGNEIESGTMPARGFAWESVRFPSRRISDVVTLNYGKSLVQSKRRNGTVPIFGTNGQCGTHDTPLSEAPGIILGRKGEGHLGVKWVTEPFWVIDTAYYAVWNQKEVDPRWFYYATSYVGLDHLKSGEKPGLSRDTFGRQIFPCPSLQEQGAIARVLGALDDKIELNRRMNRTLEEMASSLFRSWFVDFDPVVRNAEKKAGAKKVPSLRKTKPAPFQALDKLFPDAFQASDLGPTPKGWRWGTIGEFARGLRDGINPGATPMESFDHYSLPAFDGGKTPVTELGGAIKSNKFVVPPDCVMVSKLNPDTPRIWLPDLSPDRKSICSTEFIVVMPQGDATREFLYGLFSSADFTASFATYVTGTSNSHQRVQPDMLTAMDIVIPPAAVIERFTEIVRPWLRQIAHNVREAQTLAVLRDTLLPKLLSGEVRVKNTVAAVKNTLSQAKGSS